MVGWLGGRCIYVLQLLLFFNNLDTFRRHFLTSFESNKTIGAVNIFTFEQHDTYKCHFRLEDYHEYLLKTATTAERQHRRQLQFKLAHCVNVTFSNTRKIKQRHCLAVKVDRNGH